MNDCYNKSDNSVSKIDTVKNAVSKQQIIDKVVDKSSRKQ